MADKKKSTKKTSDAGVKKRKQQPVPKMVQETGTARSRSAKSNASPTPNQKRDNPRVSLPNPRRVQKQSKAYSRFIGVIFILLGAALFLMLFTFTAQDISGDVESALNIFGVIGAFIANIMLMLFGIASFLFSALSLLMGICTIRGKQFEVHPSEFVGLCILLLGSTPLLHIGFGERLILDHPAGGAFGKWLAEFGLAHIPAWGMITSGIVLSIFGSLLVTDTKFKSFFLGLWKIVKVIASALAEPFKKAPVAVEAETEVPVQEPVRDIESIDSSDSIFYEDTPSQLLDGERSSLEEREAKALANEPVYDDEKIEDEPVNEPSETVSQDEMTAAVPAEVCDDVPEEEARSVEETAAEMNESGPAEAVVAPDDVQHQSEDIGDIMARIRKSNPKSRSIKKSHSVHAVEPDFDFESILSPEQISKNDFPVHGNDVVAPQTEAADEQEVVKTSVLGNWKPRSIGRRTAAPVDVKTAEDADATVALSDVVNPDVAKKALTIPVPERPSHLTTDLLAQLATEEIDVDNSTKCASKNLDATVGLTSVHGFSETADLKAEKSQERATAYAVQPQEDAISPELRALMDEFGFGVKKKADFSLKTPEKSTSASILKTAVGDVEPVEKKKAPEAVTLAPTTTQKEVDSVKSSVDFARLHSLDVVEKVTRVPMASIESISQKEETNAAEEAEKKLKLRSIRTPGDSFVVAEEKKRVSEDELAEAEAARIRKMGSQIEYQHPPLSLLHYDPATQKGFDHAALKQYATKIEEKLAEYHIQGQVVQICPGPIITRFEFQPAPGTKVARIQSLSDDLMMALEIASIRILAPIPGKGVVGIEIPNEKRNTIYLKEIIGSQQFVEAKSILTIALGKDSEGEPVVSDLAKMPHLLVAGSTGSGKSVAINTMLCSLLYNATPDEVKLILVDPKCLELSIYEGIPHLLVPPITTPKETAAALDWACDEMDERYRKLAAFGVRNIAGYNEQLKNPSLPKAIEAVQLKDDDGEPKYKPMPYIVIVVDEFADLMMTAGKEIERSIARLAQKARAAGIHIILATQRPSTNVITGVIKANFPTRIAFRVFSYVDSRTILDTKGAESLLGMGDSLFLPPNTGILQRVHGAYVSDEEVQSIVSFLAKQRAPEYNLDITTPKDDDGDDEESSPSACSNEFDPLYDQAVQIVAETRQASASYLQRKMSIGFNRAARIIEQMEREGVVGPQRGQKPREVLIAPC